MANKTNKIMIACSFFKGELAKIPQEAKDKMMAEKPDHFKLIFGSEQMVIPDEPTTTEE